MAYNKSDEEKFVQNYTGILDPHRAYIAHSTGNRMYKLRGDLYPEPPAEKPDRNHETYPANRRNSRW